jgi:hypothetical protein
MTLTSLQKAAGRRFRAVAQFTLDQGFHTHPPDYTVPHYLGVIRHPCAGRDDRSTGLVVREVYQTSPADGDIPAGLFAFTYRAGKCPHCGATARSRTGRVVIAADRPPLHRPTPFTYPPGAPDA